MHMTAMIRIFIAAFVLALPLSVASAQHDDAPAAVENAAKEATSDAHAAEAKAEDATHEAAAGADHALHKTTEAVTPHGEAEEAGGHGAAQPGLLEPDLGTAV